jgi:tetratricopeptide (TPR) repeat protein
VRRGCAILVVLVLACTAAPPAPKPEESTPSPTEVAEPVAPASPPSTPTPPPTSDEVAPPELSREDRQKLASFLAKGRRAAREGQHGRALELFEQGLAIDRQQPKLLCEAGWAAFHADDPRAEELLREGLDLSPIGPGRAACLYSLGRVFERSDRPLQAIDAYDDSLALRPDNAETARRYRSLTGTDYHFEVGDCPPPGRFSDTKAFCTALWAAYAREQDDPELEPPEPDLDYLMCGPVSPKFDVEGVPFGELMVVEQPSPDGTPYWTRYLLLQRGGALEPLGRLGTNLGRGCSVGLVEIERVRWSTDGPVRLIVELHAESSYSCAETTPKMDCIAEAEEAGKPTSICDGVSDEYPIETVDERYRMICAEIDGQLRCSAPPEYPDEKTAAAARFDPLPTQDALGAALRCPAARP